MTNYYIIVNIHKISSFFIEQCSDKKYRIFITRENLPTVCFNEFDLLEEAQKCIVDTYSRLKWEEEQHFSEVENSCPKCKNEAIACVCMEKE